jgi:uncharacterized protein YkwD
MPFKPLKREKSIRHFLNKIRKNLTLKNFTILSILVMLIGFLSDYYLTNDYLGAVYQPVFEIGVFFFLIAYFIYALKCWGAGSKLCAVLMIAIPLLAYSLATSEMPNYTSLSLFIYLVILLIIFAIVSTIPLYVCDKLKQGIERHMLKRTRETYRYFYPKTSYSFIGVILVSLLLVSYGGLATFSNNLNSALLSSQYNSPIPTQESSGYATVQTTQASFFNQPSFTSVDESMNDINYINSIRASYGVNPIKFDNRVYNLALARVNDMDKYGYLDHTNPQTGTCAFSIKSQFGLTSNEYVAENAFGYESSTGINYYSGIEKDAINAWMTDRGHKYNMLYPHIAGAVACSSGGHCVFEGLNHDEFTNACYTAAQGEAFWATAGVQPYEHT